VGGVFRQPASAPKTRKQKTSKKSDFAEGMKCLYIMVEGS